MTFRSWPSILIVYLLGAAGFGCTGGDAVPVTGSQPAVTSPTARVPLSEDAVDAVTSTPTAPSITLVQPAEADKLVSRDFLVRIVRSSVDLPVTVTIDKGQNACDGAGEASYTMTEDEYTISLPTQTFLMGTWFGICVHKAGVSSGDRRIRCCR